LRKDPLQRSACIAVGNARTIERLRSAQISLGSLQSFANVEGDMGQPETARKLFETAVARFGQADVLVNKRGHIITSPTGIVLPVDGGMASGRF
jgi:NAD(P)-dependent dehydrogenase (short-subunit alcohol dehydrogenase family)